MQLSKILVAILVITLFLPGIVNVFLGNEGDAKADRNLFGNDLVAYWHMDEPYWDGTTGEVIDSSGNGHNSTALGTADTTDVAISGRAGIFPGTGFDYVSVPSHNDFALGLNDFSIEAWVKTDGPMGPVASGRFGFIFKSTALDNSWWLGIRNTSSIEFTFDYGNPVVGYGVHYISPTILDNNWHQLVAVRENSTYYYLYMDGELVNSSISGSLSISSVYHDNRIGDAFSDVIDEVIIYNRSLSASEVLAHFNEFFILYKGWNLIGWCGDPTTAGSLGENISGCTVVCMFNADSQSFTTHVVGIPYNDFTITNHMGLFVYVTVDSVWCGEG